MLQKDETSVLRWEILSAVVRECLLKISSRLRPEVRKVFKSRDRDGAGWVGRAVCQSPQDGRKLWCVLKYITRQASLELTSVERGWDATRMWGAVERRWEFIAWVRTSPEGVKLRGGHAQVTHLCLSGLSAKQTRAFTGWDHSGQCGS